MAVLSSYIVHMTSLPIWWSELHDTTSVQHAKSSDEHVRTGLLYAVGTFAGRL